MIALIGLNVLTGWTGQISLGHGAFMAIGAYTTAAKTAAAAAAAAAATAAARAAGGAAAAATFVLPGARAWPSTWRRCPFPARPLQIVANEARNRRRSAGRRASLALRLADEARPGDAVPSPEAALLSDERRAELLAAVEGLREEERLVVSCRFFLGLTEDETAQTLGLKLGTVKSRTSRALAQLREEVER